MEKIAIIGSGIAGLGAAYLLKDRYAITLYEKNDYYGGHARTLTVKQGISIDTGFIVFNHHTYPNLIGLFHCLHIPIKKSDMSFGVSINHGELEYGSKKIYGIFSQASNLLKPKFWQLIFNIAKFNVISKKKLKHHAVSPDLSLADYLKILNLSDWFCRYYLVAMGAAIWSTPLDKMYDFPALSFLQFFENHGLLDIHQPIQWYTVEGGSQVYVNKIVNELKKSGVIFAKEAKRVLRQEKVCIIHDDGERHTYDKVIFATHSDQSLALLDSPTEEESEILSAIRYQKNVVILHQDKNFMPKRKAAWSSWVYLSNENQDSTSISLTYWMNSLQSLNGMEDYFVTLNPSKKPEQSLIINEHIFEHPVFNRHAIHMQKRLPNLQGKLNTYYCGAYHRYGFHEDGLWSAVNVARLLGVTTPW